MMLTLCEMTDTWQDKTHLYTPTQPQHVIYCSLYELCLRMCIGKIKLSHSSQIQQLFCIQTSKVDQSDMLTLILIATNRVHVF